MSTYQLYTYDHCPYCVKARMIFGLKNVSFEHVILLNDDEKTPISMIGQKMVPILKKEDGQFMGESLDIIRYIDNKNSPIVSWEEDDFFLSQKDKGNESVYSLVMPRWVKSQMEEFKTESARNYFQNKKENMIGSFEEALKNTETFKKNLSPVLERLNEKVSPDQWYLGNQVSLNDFHLFPFLRGLTIVKGFLLPSNLRGYADWVSHKTNIALNYDMAL